CGLYGIPFETVPLAGDFSLRVEDYQRPNGGVIFPNPNAPTGVALPLDQVEALVAANPDSVVVVDEAYVDFGRRRPSPWWPATRACWWCRPSPSPVPWRACGSASRSGSGI